MRWFKHMTNSADDEKLARLMDQCGLAGYGFFWRVLELIAAQVDESGKNFCSYSKRTWCMKLAINHQTWGKMIASCEQAGLFIVAEDGQDVRVKSPNILKFRDEWTRKKGKNSGVTPEQLPSKDPDPDPEADKENLSSKGLPGDGEDADSGPTAPPMEPAYDLPLRSKASEKPKVFPVTRELFTAWEEAYPLVDMRSELKKIKSWLVSNPKKRPASDMARFVDSWLKKEQNDAARRETYAARASPAPKSYAQHQDAEQREMAQRQLRRKEAIANARQENDTRLPGNGELALPAGNFSGSPGAYG